MLPTKSPMRFRDARGAMPPEEAQASPAPPQPTPQEQAVEDSETPETQQAESLVGVEAPREADEESALRERLQGYNAQRGPAGQINEQDVELIKFILAKLLSAHEGASEAAPQSPPPQGQY